MKKLAMVKCLHQRTTLCFEGRRFLLFSIGKESICQCGRITWFKCNSIMNVFKKIVYMMIVRVMCTKLTMQRENIKCEWLKWVCHNARVSMNLCKLDLILMPNLQCLQPSSQTHTHSTYLVNNNSMKLTIAALFLFDFVLHFAHSSKERNVPLIWCECHSVAVAVSFSSRLLQF